MLGAAQVPAALQDSGRGGDEDGEVEEEARGRGGREHREPGAGLVRAEPERAREPQGRERGERRERAGERARRQERGDEERAEHSGELRGARRREDHVTKERDEEVGRGDERRERDDGRARREEERGREDREREEEREVVGGEVRARGERAVGEAEAVELRGAGVEWGGVGGALLLGGRGGAGIRAGRAEDGSRGGGRHGVRVDVGVDRVEQEGREVEEMGSRGEH